MALAAPAVPRGARGSLAAQGIAGAKRAGALGLFAVSELLDRRTVTTYLELLGGVLTRPSRGRLAYTGRDLLEHGGDTTVSPLVRVSASIDDRSFPPSHARPLDQVLPLGQDQPPGRAARSSAR